MYWIINVDCNDGRSWIAAPGSDDMHIEYDLMSSPWDALTEFLTTFDPYAHGSEPSVRHSALTLDNARRFLALAWTKEQVEKVLYYGCEESRAESDRDLDGFLTELLDLYPELLEGQDLGVDWRMTETLPEDYYAL